jgi:hypothetical protein
MGYILNSTADYHIHELNSLGWELTVCNALYPENSPCRKALKAPASFGVSLYKYLEKIIPLKDIGNVLEVGSGMGYLMHDFLSLHPHIKATMLDISPLLLEKQKANLQNFNVRFRENDILQSTTNDLTDFDLVILNENLGDLPTLVGVPDNETISEEESVYCRRADYFIKKYSLPVTPGENINIGAMEVIEKLCLASVKYIYLSEHSCEAVVPDFLESCISFTASGNPERISLKGHDEYTVKFSCLQIIAEKFNYKSIRGPFADFLELDFNDKVRTALQLSVPYSDEQEILQQFVYDLYKYEYLVLIKGDQ